MQASNLKTYQKPEILVLETILTFAGVTGNKNGNAIESSQGAPAAKRPS